MKIGIPRAMAYYIYSDLWTNFFENLGCDVVLSSITNPYILEQGINYSIDENCLASKIFMGHVHDLLGKCDYIFIPRFCSFDDGDIACVKFNALYDICKNTFKDISLITYDIDYKKKKTSAKALSELANELNIKKSSVISAYIHTINQLQKKRELENKINQKKIDIYTKNQRLNIVLVSHPYIYQDKFLGAPIISYLRSNGSNVIFSDKYDKSKRSDYQNYSKTIYFKYNKEAMIGLDKYFNIADGIVFLSVFPCGTDAIANELCIRRIKSKPVLNLNIDQQGFDAGVETRLESFLDILNLKKKVSIIGSK